MLHIKLIDNKSYLIKTCAECLHSMKSRWIVRYEAMLLQIYRLNYICYTRRICLWKPKPIYRLDIPYIALLQ